MMATAINYLDRIALNIMSDRIKVAFSLNDLQYGALESVFSFAFGMGALLVGTIVDMVSVHRVYPIMVLGWSAAGILTGYATTFDMLLGCRFFLGLFEAGNWPCGIRTTRSILRPNERSMGNALFQGGTALAVVIAPYTIKLLLNEADATGSPEGWRVPFRIIGCLGFVWILIWVATVPSRQLGPRSGDGRQVLPEGAVRFVEVFSDRRFWALVASTIAINICWHGFRAWLPLFLKARGYSEDDRTDTLTAYYLTADVGSWTVGLLTIFLCRQGVGLHPARLLMLGLCAVLATSSVVLPELTPGWQLQVGLMVIAFAGLGLFPSYYSLSQEISSLHQGKVTGTLGAFAHFSQALIKLVEGRVCTETQSYDWVLRIDGLAPLAAFLIVLALWSSSSGANDRQK
jgi:ACS family hexuronate transporter-like MFS transporter